VIYTIHLLSGCCGEGMGYSNYLYSEMIKILPVVGMMGCSYDTANTMVQKYKIKEEDCPIIVIDELGLCFAAAQVHDKNFIANLLEKIKPTKELVTK